MRIACVRGVIVHTKVAHTWIVKSNFLIICYFSSSHYSWVSGVGSVYHPHVWTACVSYSNTTSLSDRVWGEGSGGGSDYLLLVYVQGITQPSYWQCSIKTGRDGLMGPRNVPFEIACGDTSIQVEHYLIM